MIRPCDQCHGTGLLPTGSAQCPHCADMPTLPGRGSMTFRPDPESVIRWCFEHRSLVERERRCVMWMLDAIGDLEDDACDIGWVEDPTRLQEVLPLETP